MVKGALGRVAESGMELLPVCPFVASYVTKHAEYQGLVPAQRRARYGLPEAAGSS
jgi:predicted GNAT family acetyltransferase